MIAVSKKDHSNNDCLLVTVMTHGTKNGKFAAADKQYLLKELWENFLGDKCKSLIGKPKLFFIDACRGDLTDPGVIFKPKQASLLKSKNSDEVDSQLTDPVFVIPKLADLLVMYGTVEGYYSFYNRTNGTWFIQALCEELKSNPNKDLMWILTGVNRRVAYEKKTIKENKPVKKQMPQIISMLSKTLYFPPKA